MNNFLIRTFIKNYNDIKNHAVRDRYAKLSGIIGIIINTFLSLTKIIAGIIFNSIAVLADGVNNSIITLIGFKLASKPADKDHPFGHARYEYISGLLVSFLIMMLGLNLFKDSVIKIFNPDEIKFSLITVVILVISIILKFFMFSFNKTVSKKISSVTIMATAKDSLNDVIATSGVLISILIAGIWKIRLDAYIGLIISAFVIYSGYTLINGTLSPLLGEAPKEELVNLIETKIKTYPSVIGIHDLVIHNYGYNKCFATVHVEIPAKQDILYSHDIMDNIETALLKTHNIHLVIHMDPVETDNKEVAELKAHVIKRMKEECPDFSIHDFRVAFGETHNNIIFDVLVPSNCKMSETGIQKIMDKIVKEADSKNNAVITVDKNYI